MYTSQVIFLKIGAVFYVWCLSQGTTISSVVMMIMCSVDAVDERDINPSSAIQSYVTTRIQAMNVSPDHIILSVKPYRNCQVALKSVIWETPLNR